LLNPENTNNDSHLRVLDINIDTASGTVWRGDTVIDLPELSFRLLATLATQAPAMVSKDELIATIWGDVVVGDETLMQRVRLLRQALGDDGQNPRYIASVRGRGYRLAAPVEKVRSRAAPHRKNRILAIGVAVVAMFVIVVLTIGLRDTPQPPPIRTLAVLPFDDLSEDQSFGFFADGMQEELLARLADLGEISVMSRTSVEQFRGTNESIPDISDSLGADGIIEGSVRVSDNRLRITVQLIDGKADRHLWAESDEEELTVENVFAIQEKVPNSIAEALQAEYRRQEMAVLGLPTTDIEAYNLYLLGRYQVFRQTPESLDRAVVYLKQSIARDNEFAEAYASLGWRYNSAGRYADAIDAANRAQDHPDAASLLGYVYLAMGETTEALAAFEGDARRQGRGHVQIGNLAYAYFKAGQSSKGQALLDELEILKEIGFVSSRSLAAIYFAAGNEQRGYEMLEAAVDSRERSVIILNVSSSFAEQRSDPRFVAIAKRVFDRS